jgi:protein subunit release factor B
MGTSGETERSPPEFVQVLDFSTSDASIVAMERYETDRQSLERECDLEFFVAGGPGGQHRNKVETGVRLRHRPTGVVVTATERRSQYANREAAYERMAERLTEIQKVRTPRRPTRPSAAARAARVDEKKRTGERKAFRRKVDPD